MSRLLVPIDFSGHSRDAMRYASDLAEQVGAEMVLLHVIEPLPSQCAWTTPPSLSDFAPSTRHMETALKKFANSESVTGTLLVRIGHASEQIVAAAQETMCDGIVLATHGYTGRREVALGSVADYVARHAPCPVVLVREEGGGRRN